MLGDTEWGFGKVIHLMYKSNEVYTAEQNKTDKGDFINCRKLGWKALLCEEKGEKLSTVFLVQ